jgi:hypothetical protein
MAFTTPRTWTDGELVTASMLNAHVRDNIRFLKGLDGVPYIENALELPEMATPSTPASGRGRLYIGTDGAPRGIDDAGVIRSMVVYEVGTYLPTYTGTATAGTTTYTVQDGRYIRVANSVLFSARVGWSAATGTGIPVISLPFAAFNDANARWAATVFSNQVTYAGAGVQGIILGGTQRVLFTSPNSNALYTDLAVEAAGEITASGWYTI